MNTASYIQEAYKPPILAAFGNPLLDIEAIVVDKSIIKKYNLENCSQKEMSEDEFIPLLEDVTTKCKTEMRCPGGSSQNTLRILQWLIQSPGYTVMFGGIGIDDNGKYLEDAVSEDGVRTRYAYHQHLKTGTCLSFINGNRSLIAYIGAADHYGLSDLDIPENWQLLESVFMIYVEGFFITHSLETVIRLVSFCNANGISFGMNLNAPYVSENHGDKLLNLLQNADIIFGHRSEFLALSKHISSTVNTALDVAIFIQKQCLLHEKKNRKKGVPSLLREGPIIVITAGKNPVLVIKGIHNSPLEFPVLQLDEHCIKDTTGAGDAFVSGFLAAAFANLDLEKCVKNGCWAAQEIIQQIGVNTPSFSPERRCKIIKKKSP